MGRRGQERGLPSPRVGGSGPGSAQGRRCLAEPRFVPSGAGAAVLRGEPSALGPGGAGSPVSRGRS